MEVSGVYDWKGYKKFKADKNMAQSLEVLIKVVHEKKVFCDPSLMFVHIVFYAAPKINKVSITSCIFGMFPYFTSFMSYHK